MSNIETIYKSKNGAIIHGDNIEVLAGMNENSIDSCISDFPYAIEFMGKSWDSGRHLNAGASNDKMHFYDWCLPRAVNLYRVMKHGGYAAIFGHPKTNHRMKCAFEDAGFKIVEEIDWIYLTGKPKSQDIGKLFNKAGKLELAEQWKDHKTAGLKPAHEPITIFQKPLNGTYIQNIEKYGCGAMNINDCRVPMSQADIDIINAKVSKNPTNNYNNQAGKVYGDYRQNIATAANEQGRFPANIILDGEAARLFDEQIGRGDSHIFTIIKYHPKVSPSERKLPTGERNPHITVKPVEFIKWLIRLLTPINGKTIDITAGSCTHAIACEELNKNDGYNLKWIDIEIMNTEEEPYCNIGKMRAEVI